MSTDVEPELRAHRRDRLQQRRDRGRVARQHADDARGLARAVVTATTNVTGVMHKMHKAIGALEWWGSFPAHPSSDVTFASREAETTTARPQLVVERCLNR